MTYHLGTLSINKHSAGWLLTALPPSLTIYGQAKGRNPQPSAAIFDSRTLQSTPESGNHAGYDGAKRRKGSKVHAAVDTLGNLLSLLVTPANEQDRAQVGELAQKVQQATLSPDRKSVREPTRVTRRQSKSVSRLWSGEMASNWPFEEQ